jgi:polar amino acid transport system substrate-binding protein
LQFSNSANYPGQTLASFRRIETQDAGHCNIQEYRSLDEGSVVFRSPLISLFVLATVFVFGGIERARANSIRVATDAWPPFRISTKHGFVGLDLDLIYEIGRRVQTQIDIVRMPWGRGLASMESGAVDVMTGLAYREERAEYIAYTDTPYYSCETAFYTPAFRPAEINRYEDLQNHVVGFVLHSAYFERFDKDQDLQKLGVSKELMLINMTKRGRLDVMIGTDCQVDYFIKTHGLTDRIAKTAYRPGNSVDLFLGVSRKSPWAERLDELNALMKTLVDEGTIDELAKRYYNSPS